MTISLLAVPVLLLDALPAWARTASPPNFTYDVPRHVKIVHWHPSLSSAYTSQYQRHWVSNHAPNCEIVDARNKFTSPADAKMHPEDVQDADVVMFNLYAANVLGPENLPEKRPGQMWIGACFEPLDSCRPTDPSFRAKLDGQATFENTSMFPNFFTPPPEALLRRKHKDFSAADVDALATFQNSHDVEYRTTWAKDIMDKLEARGKKVLSYGDILRNTQEVPCSGPESVKSPKQDGVAMFDPIYYTNRCMSRPFALIAETSENDPWYISEKVWVALMSGSIPVYNGIHEIFDVLPPKSFIYARDYSTDALVDMMINANISEYHEWRTRPTSEWGGYEYVQAHSHFTLHARICQEVAKRPPVTSAA